jgi:hypothetical protein
MSIEFEVVNGVSRPKGWVFDHEREAELLNADGWMCERHPGKEFPHDDCSGPGMIWILQGKEVITSAILASNNNSCQ